VPFPQLILTASHPQYLSVQYKPDRMAGKPASTQSPRTADWLREQSLVRPFNHPSPFAVSVQEMEKLQQACWWLSVNCLREVKHCDVLETAFILRDNQFLCNVSIPTGPQDDLILRIQKCSSNLMLFKGSIVEKASMWCEPRDRRRSKGGHQGLELCRASQKPQEGILCVARASSRMNKILA